MLCTRITVYIDTMMRMKGYDGDDARARFSSSSASLFGACSPRRYSSSRRVLSLKTVLVLVLVLTVTCVMRERVEAHPQQEDGGDSSLPAPPPSSLPADAAAATAGDSSNDDDNSSSEEGPPFADLNNSTELEMMDENDNNNNTNSTGIVFNVKNTAAHGGAGRRNDTDLTLGDARQRWKAALDRLPAFVNRNQVQRLPTAFREDADKLFGVFAGNIQSNSFQQALTAIPTSLVPNLIQGDIKDFNDTTLSVLRKLLPQLDKSVLCSVNDTQKEKMINAVADCSSSSSSSNATELRQTLLDVSDMFARLKTACNFRMSPDLLKKTAACIKQMSEKAGSSKANDAVVVRALLAHLPANLSLVTQDMVNAVGQDALLRNAPISDLAEMSQVNKDLLSKARSDISVLMQQNNQSDVKRYQAIISALTQRIQGPAGSWNSSTLAQEIQSLAFLSSDTIARMNGSALDANMAQITELVKSGKLTGDQQAAIASAWGRSTATSMTNRTAEETRLLGERLPAAVLCQLPNEAYYAIRNASVATNKLREFRERILNTPACMPRVREQLSAACRNQTNMTGFDGLVSNSADSQALANICATYGNFMDFQKAASGVLNSTSVEEQVKFLKDLTGVRRKNFVEDVLSRLRVNNVLNFAKMPDELLHEATAVDIDSASNDICAKADKLLEGSAKMDVGRRTALLRKLTTAAADGGCGKTLAELVKAANVPAAIKNILSTTDVKAAVASGQISRADLKTATAVLPCGSPLRRIYMELEFNNTLLTVENITSDRKLVCSMDCHNVQNLTDEKLLVFIGEACASAQPMKIKAAACLKTKLCTYVERYESTSAGASTDDVRCLADLASPTLELVCLDILTQFSEKALRGLTGDKSLTVTKKAAQGSQEFLVRYPHSKMVALAASGLRSLQLSSSLGQTMKTTSAGADGGSYSVKEEHAAQMNCLASWLQDDVAAMSGAALVRTLDCWGKQSAWTASGLPITPLVSKRTAAAVGARLKVLKGPVGEWTAADWQQVGCVAKFLDMSELVDVTVIRCNRSQVPDYLADEFADVQALKKTNLDESLAFDEASVDQQILKRKIQDRRDRIQAEQAAVAAARPPPAPPVSSTTSGPPSSATATTPINNNNNSPPSTDTATTPSTAGGITTTSLAAAARNAKVMVFPGPADADYLDDDYNNKREEQQDGSSNDHHRPKRQVTTTVAVTCDQIERDGIGANGLTTAQIEAMTPANVTACLGPLGSVRLDLISAGNAIFNKVKLFYSPLNNRARDVPVEAMWKLDYAAVGITTADVADMTLNLKSLDNRTVLADLSVIGPDASRGFGSDQIVKFAEEIRSDTGSFSSLTPSEVQAMGLFMCGTATADIDVIPGSSLISSISTLKQLPCEFARMNALIQGIRRPPSTYSDVMSWTPSVVGIQS
ncbi:unnamed protein product [Notodromas monacha]|uniref:Uncharacterized protein n=1 Tax=Notodromas monacha TaxID=399045 RepID=A0A7R9GFT1_9CRUS|nr:unnamed protein product [Notodromas monacha]CAG0919477.1 unnamed protein product [Notodromas monacha]